MKVIIAFTALTASAIGICRKTALTCAARISSRTSSGSTLSLKKPRISSHSQGYERNAARDRASSGTQVEQSIQMPPTGRAAINDPFL
jgi:hypothetical protein